MTAIMPLPLLIIGGILRTQPQSSQFSVELVDLDLLIKQGHLCDDPGFYHEATCYLLKKAPAICFFTTHGVNLPLTIQLCEQLKRHSPQTLTVLGGIAATLQATEIVKTFNSVDLVIKGEAEAAVPELMRQALGGKNFSKVPSAVFKCGGQIINNPRTKTATNAEFPAPDYSLVKLEHYRLHNAKFPYIYPGFALVESGRGCRFNCSFCAPAKMWQRQTRLRPIDQIMAEIRFLNEHGFDFTFFTQDNLDVPFLRELAGAFIRENMNIKWGGYARINQIDEDTLELIAQSGCKLLFVGLETPNKQSQKSIRKSLDRAAMLRQVGRFADKGIKLICSFIAGFDGETAEELENTLEYALECATAHELTALKDYLATTPAEQLPDKPVHFSTVHVLSGMPGTDFAAEVETKLRLTSATLHHDAFGSSLFGLDDFTRRHWRSVFNSYTTHLSEEQVIYYYPLLRIFNMLAARPFNLAWLLAQKKIPLLALLQHINNAIGRRTVLRLKKDDLQEQLGVVLSNLSGTKALTIEAERVVG
jgi:radical SAM superfamily enzyme YgiQ (UPF0313 family)